MAEQLEKLQPRAADADFETELEAIRAIVGALTPLSDESRISVISYVFRRLGISFGDAEYVEAQPEITSEASRSATVSKSGPVDIRTLKEEKQPSSAREMAVLVAYYLSELAPANQRKTEISADDLRQYFKQGAFKLPTSPEMTLVHTRNAGYLDSGSARGLYKLNAVGYNLIVHSLPASPGSAKPKRKKRNARKKRGR
jgi:hypothetical protein